MIKLIVGMSVIILCMTGCSVKPVPIIYGSDICDFCTMSIVDPNHASEVVTRTGKALKYDSIECMMNSIKRMEDQPPVELFLVNFFTKPGHLTDATKAVYVKSEDIPSPMGAFLSAFPNREAAEKLIANDEEARYFNWEELKAYFIDNIN